MEAALFPPMAAHILLIFVGAISMVALVGIAYNYSLTRSTREKIARVEELERDVKILQRDIKVLQDRLPKDAIPDNTDTKPAVDKAAGGAMAGNVKQEVWQGFVDDYNNLANSMNIPKAAEACENFVRNNKVQLLVCVESQKAEDGKTLVYTAVDNVESSRYWAWNVTGKPDDFAVVPNPLIEYNEELHHKGGMKETFASNYETGSFKQVQVKLPAHFTLRQGKWVIVQPGVIRVN